MKKTCFLLITHLIFISTIIVSRTEKDLPSHKLKPKEKVMGFTINGLEDLDALEKATQKSNHTSEKKEQVTTYHVKDFSEKEKIILAASFAHAPARLKNLIERIERNEPGAEKFKHILLTGPSGAGKSTLAEAIACKLQRRCIVINAPSLLSHYRDKASENLNELFSEFQKYDERNEEKPVLIINEINVLTDNHTSEHSDTKNTATQLWCKLDEIKKSKGFLLIATTNVTKKMPHQLQSRFRGSTFVINFPNSEPKKELFKMCLQEMQLELDESFTDQYLQEFIQRTAAFSYRDIESIIDISYMLCDKTNKITRNIFEQALAEYEQQTKEVWDYTNQATEEERRHQEVMTQNKRHYEDNKETQIQLAELNILFQAMLTAKSTGNGLGLDKTVEQFHKAEKIIFPERKPKGNLVYTGFRDGYTVE